MEGMGLIASCLVVGGVTFDSQPVSAVQALLTGQGKIACTH